jgi:DNA polymerase sigma
MKPPKFNPSFNMNKKPPQNIDNKNINTINTSQKSHWDYFQYNNNQANSLQIFNSFIPSEKYFDSLDKELNNYINVTNNNISLLKNIQEENLKNLENFLQEKLSDNYEIKFGHYGSFFTELNIEGSDLDILIYYKKKKEENDIIKDILIILKEYLPQLDNIMPILTASVPVIKLQIDIKDEIKELKLKQTSYFEEDDLNKIKIDITFTENEKDFLNSQNTVNYIKNSVKDYPQIKPMLQILKRYFKIMGMNKSYTGGLCSYSLFLLVLSFCKCNKQCLSPTKLLYYFMENFTYFDYCNYCIDVKSENCYILKEKEKIEFNLENNEKSISEENSSFDTNYDLYEKEEIFIVDPISNNNVSKSSFRVDEIILTFRKGFNLLYYEGWYYDCYNNNGIINDNKIIENINELYQEDETSNYMTIKKLFNLKVLKNNFDFYFN